MQDRVAFHQFLRQQNGGQWFDFEGLIRDIYVDFLRSGDVALDIGVNRGDHFLQMIPAVGNGGLIIGAEASPVMVELVNGFLKSAGYIRRDNIMPKNIRLFNVAVSNYTGTTTFNFIKDQPGLSSLANRDVAKQYQTEVIECAVTTIDAICPVDRKIAFAKIDIEGGECHALLGAEGMLRSSRPPIVFEFDRDSPKHFNYRCEDLIGLFHKNNYRIFDLFGFEYQTADELMTSDVWNYIAVPVDRPLNFAGIVFNTLRKQGLAIPETD